MGDVSCGNCLEPANHRHHIVPKVLGGTDNETNLVWLCEPCHGKVHDRRFLNHSALTKAGLQAAKARGVKLGGSRLPPGDAESAAKARAAHSAKALLFAKGFFFVKELHDGGMSFRRIAIYLNEGGYKSRQGGNWHPSSVKYLLEKLEKGLELS